MSHKLTNEELDEQFELFLKEPVSDDSIDFGGSLKQSTKSSQKSAQKPAVPWWQDDEHGGGGKRTGETKSRFVKGKKSQPEKEGLPELQGSFINSLKKHQPVEKKEEDSQNTYFKKKELNAVVFNRDTPKAADSMMVTGMNMTMGLDTLEEEKEKAKFFAQLEAGISSAIDYSKLNKELDTTASTIDNKLRTGDKSVEQIDEDQSNIRDTERITFPGSPHYGEDFEKEEDKKKPQEKRSKLSPILAKVSLYDSLDDCLKKNTVESLDRDQTIFAT
ncbi:centrosomal protein of 162 kDa isoform X2 [Betta splendens]|uniref:Centrosomal protein of 162 kDa n=1 Tax=Betta splendens TaxID=158456 RepID=A0A8M1H5X4_BETSP|nr:centrosomal protein of 162 kDa isoform X2 [Betta splendens]